MKFHISLKTLSQSFKKGFTSLNLSLIATLLLIFFFTENSLQIDRILQTTALIGLIWLPVTKTPYYWLFVTTILVIGHAPEWHTIDNHKYLITWWCATLAIWFIKKPSVIDLKRNASVLIGLCFLFATFWKIITPEYINGSFFNYLLLGGDTRFNDFSSFVTGLSPETLKANRDVITGARYSGDYHSVFSLETSKRAAFFAGLFTWWTVAIEGIIAFAFLSRKHLRISRYRDYFLMVFILSTYTIASVIGFAWALIAMGIAQTEKNNRLILTAYTLLFILMSFFASSLIPTVKSYFPF